MPASGPPELDELSRSDPEEPSRDAPPLSEPVAIEESDEPPASVVCAAPPAVEPHAVANREAAINAHHEVRRTIAA